MIQHTFCHLPKIRQKNEIWLWERGFKDWYSVVEHKGSYPKLVERNLALIHQSIHAYKKKDWQFFQSRLASQQQWRLFKDHADSTAYLDIETSATHAITCIGVYDGETPNVFIEGDNLSDFPEAIQAYTALVTFNGKSFDLPKIRKHFPDITLPSIHFDLLPILKSLGYKGGLKSIEKQLGIYREGEMGGVNGYIAVLLWNLHTQGNKTALPTLIRYNLEDVVNLEYLMMFAYNEHCKALGWGSECLLRKPVYPLDNPFDAELIRELKDYIQHKAPR